MKLGVVTSYFDDLFIMSFLNKYNFDFEIYFDWENWPYQDKWINSSLASIRDWIDYLKNKNVDKIILPPIYEFLIQDDLILDIFNQYLYYSLDKSIVWKIWILWDFSDSELVNDKLKKEISKYKANEKQINTKNFNHSFPIWFKQVNLWKYFLYNLSFKQPLVNKSVKTDLRYFKDAYVDTVIPLNYWYFAFQKVIKNFLNQKKIKFHWKDILTNIIDDNLLHINSWRFSVNINYTWDIWLFLSSKKWNWIINRWKQNKFNLEEVR